MFSKLKSAKIDKKKLKHKFELHFCFISFFLGWDWHYIIAFISESLLFISSEIALLVMFVS